MASINVAIKDKKTLVLLEDAKKDDVIELDKLTKIDTSFISDLINQELQNEMEKRIKSEVDKALNTQKNQLELSYRQNETKLKESCQKEILTIQENLAKHKENSKDELNQKNLVISNLQHELEELKRNFQKDLQIKTSEIQNQYNDKFNNLQNENHDLKQQLNTKETLYKNELTNNNLKNEIAKEKELSDLKVKLSDDFSEKEKKYLEKISALERLKSSLNVKNIGEDLESWCDREVASYMQNGFTNCTWEKDNRVIKDDDETRGSKADFIFKIYADDTHQELLTSICMDMKDENPDSKNKKTNKDYYHQLDKNRNKKDCKYAVLVSSLEADKSNDIPIFKVNEYPDMYVVRPAYLMTFLNMIVSLSTRFRKLIADSKKQQEKFQSYAELQKSFDDIKNTYLDKPLIALKNEINNIKKQNEYIIKANDNIKKATLALEELTENIEKKYINIIIDKLEKFDLKLKKSYTKADNLLNSN